MGAKKLIEFEGRMAIREIDATTISELPGLAGLTLLEDALDGALERAAEKPGYAGVAGAPLPERGSEPAYFLSSSSAHELMQ